MGIVPEKNDVDISKLFMWGKEGVVTDNNGNEVIKFYIRLIGDADINQARVHALRRSAEMRRLLKSNVSDERLAFIPEFDLVEKPNLVGAILMLKAKEIGDQVAREVTIPFPKEPSSEATLEEQEAYQKEVDEYPNKMNNAIQGKVKELLGEEEENLNKWDKQKLYDEYVAYLINDLCEKAMYDDFKNSCVYYGTFKDSTCEQRIFDSARGVASMPTEIKEQFIDAYSELELNTDFLKKLQGATQS
jgi:hypothetical protein